MDNNLEMNLVKGQRISLERADGSKIEEFCMGVNWGAIKASDGETIDVGLDLNCIFIDENNEICDNLDWAEEISENEMETDDGAVQIPKEDTTGDLDGDDGLDNETITVNLSKIDGNVAQIFFSLNLIEEMDNLGEKDFSQIPYVKIRIYEGETEKLFARFDVANKEYYGKRAFIIGKLIKNGINWEFQSIGDPTDDNNIGETIERIRKSYLQP